MDDGARFELESGWLPPGEFDRLTAHAARDLDGVTVTRDRGAGERGTDPTVVVAVVAAAATLLLPFVNKLAERLFRAEPTATLTIEVSGGGQVVVDAGQPAEERAGQLEQAVGAGLTRIRIGR
nr:hypothetical protein GCM10020063_052000 [Dactylosporangium thailandense]